MTEVTGQEGYRETEHSRSWLVRAGIVVTIAASVAGLVTTGVATLFGAKVAESQLDQSRGVAEEKERAQAARVSYWVDLQPKGRLRLHLMNRSPDPIANVQMTFAVTLPPSGYPDPERVFFAVTMPSVPPCSDIIFTADDMTYSSDELSKGHFIHPQYDDKTGKAFRKEWIPLPIEEFVADFSDRDGVRWRRTRGLLIRNPEDPEVKRGRFVGYVQAVPPVPLKSCGG
ncbi:hypothetical protein ACIOHR_05920 [Streptomyces anulatus]